MTANRHPSALLLPQGVFEAQQSWSALHVCQRSEKRKRKNEMPHAGFEPTSSPFVPTANAVVCRICESKSPLVLWYIHFSRKPPAKLRLKGDVLTTRPMRLDTRAPVLSYLKYRIVSFSAQNINERPLSCPLDFVLWRTYHCFTTGTSISIINYY